MHEDPPRLPRAATAAVALLLFALLAVAVRLGWTQATDLMLLDLIRGAGGPALRQRVVDLTALGSASILLPLVVFATLLFLARGDRRGALRLLITVLGGRLAVELVKDLAARARPPLIDQAVAVHSWSFPSAHAANSAIIYLALAAVAVRRETRPAARAVILGAAIIASLTIGLTRPWLGVHWPSDVLAGWLFGLGWVALCSAVARRWAGKASPARPSA
jgi:undecaprenyl-diphosphatase